MRQSLMTSPAAAHPQPITPVEREFLEDGIRRSLLQAPSAGDQKVIDRKRDIRKGFNRVADTVSHLLVHSYNEGKPITKQLVQAIEDFFSVRTQRIQRRFRDLNPIETKGEGDINNVQMAIAQGDESTPTLIRLITDIDEYVPVLLEMRAAAVTQIQGRTA